jgi:2-polyprenyl-6-methoxyphenol hydroxylase-like FAD-dependent oxidoreductase
MKAIGLLEPLFQVGNEPRYKVSREAGTNKIMYSADIAELTDLYGAPFLSLHRGDLQHLLTGALAPGAIQFEKRLAQIRSDSTLCYFEFSDGTTGSSDIVIGADGINSKIRETLIGTEAPRYSGVTAYRTIIPAASLGDLELDDYTKWWGSDRYLVSYFVSSTRDEYYILALIEEPWLNDTFAQTQGDIEMVRAAFTNFHPTVRRILSECKVFSRAPILDRNPQTIWSRGRIVMLGDACHPMAPYMGQGAGMAIEDAVTLVRCLETASDGEPQAQFQRYATTRLSRTSRVQAESAKNEWMRSKMDHSWLYGYDVLTAPLADTPSGPINLAEGTLDTPPDP